MTVAEGRMRNLARANEIRIARSALKRRVDAGEVSILEALSDPCAASMSLERLLISQHSWGPVRAGQLLERIKRRGVLIGSSRRVCELTERQVTALAEGLVVEACERGKT